MYEHLHWANQRILEVLKTMDPIDSHKARRLFSHILCSEQVWLTRIHGKESSQLPLWIDHGIGDCEELVKRNDQCFSELLSSLSDASLDQQIKYKNSKGYEFKTSLIDILTHVALHGQYHRGQLNVQLRRDGFDPINLDFITFERLY